MEIICAIILFLIVLFLGSFLAAILDDYIENQEWERTHVCVNKKE